MTILCLLVLVLSFNSITASQKVVGAKSLLSYDEIQEDTILASAAKDAVRHIEMQSTIDNHLVLSRILSGSKQVVSGIKYELQLEVLPTDCPRGFVADENSSKRCSTFEGSQVIYDVDLFYKSWANPPLQSCTIKRYREIGSSDWTIPFNHNKEE
jgi:hypothetical protein